MNQETSESVTELLARFRRGERDAEAKLMALVYDELHRQAVRYMRRERRGHSLQPTALVHEAYLRLVNQPSKSWKNRAHFFAIAALVMRRILVDHARRRMAEKRGAGKVSSIDDRVLHRPMLEPEAASDIMALNEALDALARVNPRQSRIIEMRFFADMSVNEIGEILDIAERTVQRESTAAQKWLSARIRATA